MSRESITAAQNEAFRGRAARSKAHYAAAGCNYWLFEEDGAPGSYVEFVEAPDRETLLAARRAAPSQRAAAPTFTEVRLT
jgi:hypothetical protein